MTDFLVSLFFFKKPTFVGIVNVSCFVVKYLGQGILRGAGPDILVFSLLLGALKHENDRLCDFRRTSCGFCPLKKHTTPLSTI
jgi:hypothetical protein